MAGQGMARVTRVKWRAGRRGQARPGRTGPDRGGRSKKKKEEQWRARHDEPGEAEAGKKIKLIGEAPRQAGEAQGSQAGPDWTGEAKAKDEIKE